MGENNTCFPSTYASTSPQASGDIWYSFNLCSTSNVNISLCGSTFDTYLHLLDGAGNHIASNTNALTITSASDATSYCQFYNDTISNANSGIGESIVGAVQT